MFLIIKLFFFLILENIFYYFCKVYLGVIKCYDIVSVLKKILIKFKEFLFGFFFRRDVLFIYKIEVFVDFFYVGGIKICSNV